MVVILDPFSLFPLLKRFITSSFVISLSYNIPFLKVNFTVAFSLISFLFFISTIITSSDPFLSPLEFISKSL
jgi:hypothetical protein